jgi:hypothetical protein
MFEPINRAADMVAANISLSRRGFIDRIGRAAMAAAGAIGGLLALPGQSQAGVHRGFCQVVGGGRIRAPFYYSGICVESGTCSQAVACAQGFAPRGAKIQRLGCASGSWTLVDANRSCAF